MNHYEVDIEKEGFIKVIQRGKIGSTKNKSLKDYLFYLNFNNRATIYNNPNNLISFDNNIYSYIKEINYNLKDKKKNTIKSIELIMSFSSTFNKILLQHFGKEWKTIYMKEIEKILNENINYISQTSFYHEFDSSLYRLHNHTLILPYKKEEKKFKNNKVINLVLSKPYIEKEVLKKMKIQLNEVAKKLWKEIPPKSRIIYFENLKNIKRNFNAEKYNSINKHNLKINNINNEMSFWNILKENVRNIENKEAFYFLYRKKEEEIFIQGIIYKDIELIKKLLDTIIESKINNKESFKYIIDWNLIWDKVLRSRNQWILLKLIYVLEKLEINYKKYESNINNIFTVGKDYKYMYDCIYIEQDFKKQELIDKKEKTKNQIKIKNN